MSNCKISSSSTAFPHAHPSHWEHKASHHSGGFKNPTHVEFYDPQHDITLEWHSRKHRKGRFPQAKTGTAKNEKWNKKKKPRFPRLIGFDFKDISWHVAMLFLIGSVWWCVNGVMVFNFFYDDADSILNAESAIAFLGGSWFIVGAYLSFVESLNPSRDTDFGYTIDEEAHTLLRKQSTSSGSLGRSRNHFGKHHAAAAAGSHAPGKSEDSGDLPEWRWWGSDWHSIGFVANAIQLFGASIFWISTLCGLPGILPLSGASDASGIPGGSIALWEVFYWVPQIIGAPCFVISGLMFCIECQRKWWLPAPFTLGWQIGFWNLIGGWGFWFCAIFGVLRETGGSKDSQYWGTAFSTYWGSWAFLLGSYLQLYETLNK